MPIKAALDAFITQVISGDHVGAIRDWYHDDAWMQENQAPPIQGGREAMMKRESAMMDRSQSVTSELLGGPLVEGDQVAIRWRFTFIFKDGKPDAAGRDRLADLAGRQDRNRNLLL
ncbi:MAG TPA: nuclear transport factor 2 family protein [Stellaceae bacterium]|nr:nuclear transport factor 2 family protein [Stellaceae bacterium]